MQSKVVEFNLEYDMPTVDVALQKLKNALTTYKGLGCKAVIIIHGYGASGVGGSIKAAVPRCLNDNSMRGIVRAYVGGGQWYNRKREILAMCKTLENYERRIANNEGVTVVILK